MFLLELTLCMYVSLLICVELHNSKVKHNKNTLSGSTF